MSKAEGTRPEIMATAMEAIIGAIFIDDGTASVEKVMLNLGLLPTGGTLNAE